MRVALYILNTETTRREPGDPLNSTDMLGMWAEAAKIEFSVNVFVG